VSRECRFYIAFVRLIVTEVDLARGVGQEEFSKGT
jgi:hypothetical protein